MTKQTLVRGAVMASIFAAVAAVGFTLSAHPWKRDYSHPRPGDTAHWPPKDCWELPPGQKSNRCALHFYWRACDQGLEEGCLAVTRLRMEGVPE